MKQLMYEIWILASSPKNKYKEKKETANFSSQVFHFLCFQNNLHECLHECLEHTDQVHF